MAQTDACIRVSVEIPQELVGDVDVSSLGLDLRRLWALEQVRQRRLGIGRAAEVARMPRAAFMVWLGEHGLPVIDYPAADLQQELGTADRR
jgi:predicted HTH domain antitoxin